MQGKGQAVTEKKQEIGRKSKFGKGGRYLISLLTVLIMVSTLCSSCSVDSEALIEVAEEVLAFDTEDTSDAIDNSYSLEDIPEYSGDSYVVIKDNVPEFTEQEIATAQTSYEEYSELDYLGRCGAAEASIGVDIMPTEERTSIGMIKPTGWHTVRYDDLIEGKYLYNRCHLIAFCLAGENANEKNLITGTRYMNVTGMLPFEEDIADYVETTGNHVLYRVVPIFEGEELVARGVHMQAYSVEDDGEGICFNVYCYNVQPGITIDYATGESSRA